MDSLHFFHLGFIEVRLFRILWQLQRVQIQEQFQHLDAEIRELDLLWHRVELLKNVINRGRPMEHLGMAAGAEFILEPGQIHRKFPYPLLQRLGGLGERKANGDPVIMGKGEGKMALVLQPPVQLQVPRFHIGISIRSRRVLHPSLAAIVDAQQISGNGQVGVVILHVEVVIHEIDAGEQVILSHDPLPSLTLELEDPANEPNYDNLLVLGVTPEKAPDEAEYVTMTFEAGVPKTLNGQAMKVSEIITELNKLGGKHGIGIVDIVENRVVGMKSRGVYETPGGTILMEAHDQLEELVLDRATMEVKKDMGNKMAQIVYEGKWFTPLREAVQAFVESTQKYVTGEVKFKLYKGNIIKAGTTSPYSLYSESLASFTTGELYDHHDASGFITLFGLPLKVRAMMLAENEKNN
mgnify:CR=1 FL=1